MIINYSCIIQEFISSNFYHTIESTLCHSIHENITYIQQTNIYVWDTKTNQNPIPYKVGQLKKNCYIKN